MAQLRNFKKNYFILMVFVSFIGLSTYAQQTDQRISMDFKNEALSSAFKRIENASNYKIIFSYDAVRNYKVTAHIKNLTPQQAVSKVISNVPLNMVVKDRFITISAKKENKNDQQLSSGQNYISGVITDEHKETLIGVSVTVPGSPYGTITNADGFFELTLPDQIRSLQVSYVGMRTENVAISKTNKRMSIILYEDSKMLNDVVITGYQTISKERATGSFSMLSSKDMEVKRLNTISSILEGGVAGYSNGQIRGLSSMMGETAPLYVVDGFPVENQVMNYQGQVSSKLPELNMDDIENITVLKDAAAASIYGARAANGVIVITTKSGSRKDKLDVGFSATMTWSPYKYYTGNLASSADYISLEKEWAETNTSLHGGNAQSYAQKVLAENFYPNAGIRSILNYYAGNTSQSQMDSELNKLSSQGYEFYRQVEKYAKRNPLYQQYNFNMSKSTAKNSFKASVTYKSNRFEDLYSKDESLGMNLRNITKVTKWMDVEIGSFIQFSGEDTQTNSALSPLYTTLPYDVLRNSDGSNYTRTSDLLYGSTKQEAINKYGLYSMDITPLNELGNNISNINKLDLRTFARVNIQLLPFLKYTASFQYERGSNKYKLINDKSSYAMRSLVNSYASIDNGEVKYNIPYGDAMEQRDQYRKSYNFRQQLNLDYSWNNRHNVTAILGTETRENRVDMHKSSFYGYDEQLLNYTAVNEATLKNGFSNTWGGYASLSNLSGFYENLNRYVSFYGNVAYSLDDKYSLTASMRWDRSNLWGTSSKYQNKPIWSTGASWLVNREGFMKSASWIDMLKLRLSYGITGNINPEYSPYMVAYYNPNYNVGGVYGSISSRPNSQLSWEKTTITNVGIDFSVLNNRLRGTIEYYNKYGENLLSSTNGVPTEGYGYSTYALNNGEMRNRGLELSVNGDVIKNNDFVWTANAIFSTNKNKVTYVNVKAPVYYLALDYSTAYPTIGDPYGGLYGYQWAGLSSDGLPQVYNEKGDKVTDQPTTLDAIKFLGNSTPTYNGSFGSTFSYKGFDISFLFVYEGNYKIRNSNMPFLNYSYASGLGYVSKISNLSSDIANRWQKPGDELYTDIPRACFSEAGLNLTGMYSTYYYSSANLLDAANIRLSNVSLAYHVPSAICHKIYCQSMRLQANVENPCMWAKSKQAKYQLGGFVSPNYMLGIYLNF